ncbi:unnamed protein product [Mytilus coruscus]|uniref:TIR domain-containing protein n=1 Tax=Mytilus coruscus TaxID=42192 RepID=A0A6J8AEY5_MYTCO|nr:unnamed protein product [Mytilus coruscus]
MLGYKETQCREQGLTSVPINLPPEIKKLDLSSYKLTRLDANIFLRYKYLEHLMLDNNVIRLLHEKAFNGLSLLIYLSLFNNYLNITESYPPEVFESLKNLSVLDINRNMKTSECNPYRIPVAYSYDSVCFVKELQEKMENEWGFNLCIEDRDFIAGESIATERATFINKWRHIIFVVSPFIIENE